MSGEEASAKEQSGWAGLNMQMERTGMEWDEEEKGGNEIK